MVKTADEAVSGVRASGPEHRNGAAPTAAQRRYLERGLDEPGGKLPLFDRDGGQISRRTIEACIAGGWAEQWFANPVKPDWLVCRLTDEGYRLFGRERPDCKPRHGNS